ncbi:MAG: secretin N-terminal domain-containing protein [Campylobacterota bacterium]|nr:secretin N-terminal domain-containing protein [Campylobacterota bacterium]
MIAQKKWTRGIALLLMVMILPVLASAGKCSSKLFTVTIDSKLSIGDAVENLADTCDMTVIVKDEWAKKRLEKKLYFVKLKNSTLKRFLNTILTDNDLNYKLNGNKLTISYLTTRTFKIHYIAGSRIGESATEVSISGSSSSGNQGSTNTGGSGGGDTLTRSNIKIENKDEFNFWTTVGREVQQILSGANDDGLHYTRAGDSWIGPDGKKWEYNPLEPIINPVAGMVTVTGTYEQLARVSRYVKNLEKQLKTQVLIDVRIITVLFDDSTTTGVDWNQLYKLQNMTINTYAMGQQNMLSWESNALDGITGEKEFYPGTVPKSAGLIEMTGTTDVQDIVKFLSTQGEVRAVSSPRVMTLNNQPALISVGKDIYYKTTYSNVLAGGGGVGGGSSTQGENINSVFEGVLLDITPQIGNNGVITLKINPSVSTTNDPAPPEGITRTIPPDMTKRQLSSVIKVKDGHHAILGGLITTKTGTKINKVPLLGDLPLFEYAFKQEEKIEEVVELVIIVTPHIVNNSKDVSLRDLGYKRVNGK